MILTRHPRFALAPILLIFTILPRGAAQDGEVARLTVAETRPRESDPAALAIVERGLASIGGRERLARVASLSRRGTIRVDGQEGFIGEFFAAPARRRAELFYSQASWITVADGERVERAVSGEMVKLTNTEKAEWALRANPWPELRAKELNLIFALGHEIQIDGRPAFGVRGYYDYGAPPVTISWTDYYDAETGRLSRRDEGSGAARKTTLFQQYQESGGIAIPRSITRTIGRRVSEFTFREVETGAAVSPEWMNPLARRVDEPLVVTTIPEKLHREPLDAGLHFDQLSLRVALPNVVAAPDTIFTIQLLDGARAIETRTLPGTAAIVDDASGVAKLPLYFTFPSDTHASKVNITIEEKSPPRRKLAISRDVDRYHSRTDLILPLRMPAMIMKGHSLTEHHSRERSQVFSYDLAGCDFDGAIFTEDAQAGRESNENYHGWGMEVIAPAAGKVVFVRNNISDNPRPGEIAFGDSYVLDGTIVFGNCIIIDHLNGEFSLLGHLQHSSVRMKEGDSVAAGDVLGLLGNSGYSSAPHLHYQLMDSPLFFEGDGLPARFSAVLELYTGQRMPYLRAGATVKPTGPAASRPSLPLLDAESRLPGGEPESAPASRPKSKRAVRR